MKSTHTMDCPSGDVWIQHVTYSGMLIRSERMTPDDATRRLVHRITWWEEQGYPVTVRKGTPDAPRAVEVETPDTAALIGDVEGLYEIIPVQVFAYRCWECGDELPIGVSCDCAEPRQDEE